MSVNIRIQNAVKRYGELTVLPDLSLNINEGEFFTLLGASGCGKTTLLRMIAGFNSIEGGDFYFNDKRINDIPPHKRNIGMVFQDYAIFPHMSAGKNIAFGLKEKKVKEPELSKRVEEILDTVQISELRDRMPQKMSGGQQQRIALARAIVVKPDVLLMDEPLSNLDAKLRVEMRTAIKHIQNEFKITTVYVTHDQEEALAISDRIAVMRLGVIQQVDNPINIYQRPANLYVATFIGQSNLLDGTLDSGTFVMKNGYSVSIKGTTGDVSNRPVKVCVRLNEFFFDETGLEAKITERVFFGVHMQYSAKLTDGTEIMFTSDINRKTYDVGDTVHLAFDCEAVNVFDAQSGSSIMEGVAQYAV